MPGNCRHFTVLTVAVPRAHGIPARARCGFSFFDQLAALTTDPDASFAELTRQLSRRSPAHGAR